MTGLIISCADSELVVFPQLGGAIGNWRWRGLDILRPAPEHGGIESMACFSMVPFANRLGHGRLAGYPPLAPNAPPEPHSLHGVGWQRPWRISVQRPDSVELSLHHDADAFWPFDFIAVCKLRLEAGRLSMTLTVCNTDRKPMPCGAGFHPYFPLDAYTRLESDWYGMWEIGSDLLPTTHRALASPEPLLAQNWRVNNCFTGWKRVAKLYYAAHTVTLRADPGCPYLQCYQPGADHGYIALEPVSHVPNAHQMKTPERHGLRLLSIGESFSITMSINVEATP